MANLNKILNGKIVEMSDEEQAEYDARQKAWTDGAPARRMTELRRQRNLLLSESDWMGNQDVTMSNEWKTYRQALRDITSQTPSDDLLSNINWPTKPS